MPVKRFFLVCALCSPAAHAEQWFSLATADRQPNPAVDVEVDLDSVGLRGGAGETIIRVTYDVLQPHPAGFGYRSFVASVQFDCKRRAVTPLSAAYYALPAGRGARVGADSSARASGMPANLLARIPADTQQALLRATCVGG